MDGGGGGGELRPFFFLRRRGCSGPRLCYIQNKKEEACVLRPCDVLRRFLPDESFGLRRPTKAEGLVSPERCGNKPAAGVFLYSFLCCALVKGRRPSASFSGGCFPPPRFRSLLSISALPYKRNWD
uniref:Uncharacterized protein ORF125_1 n=1 Tax=Phaeoceros laevis TaxID=37308 RepID=D3J0J6_9EMBR|nr:hypothetical protein PhlaMp26 [Phaeoceros laevis]ACT75310.1 hypothetical protein PhlaMp26 [Phaeoceros laevis]